MNLIIKRTKIFGLIKYAFVSMLILILPIMSSCDDPYSSVCMQEAKALHTAMMVIAHQDENDDISITDKGLTFLEENLEDLVEDITGIRYTIEYDYPENKYPERSITSKLYVKNNTDLAFFTVENRMASIIWSTSAIKII